MILYRLYLQIVFKKKEGRDEFVSLHQSVGDVSSCRFTGSNDLHNLGEKMTWNISTWKLSKSGSVGRGQHNTSFYVFTVFLFFYSLLENGNSNIICTDIKMQGKVHVISNAMNRRLEKTHVHLAFIKKDINIIFSFLLWCQNCCYLHYFLLIKYSYHFHH